MASERRHPQLAGEGLHPTGLYDESQGGGTVPTGLVEVGGLLVLTVIVLPCCFFTLLALLDRFERSLALDAGTVRQVPGAAARELAPGSDAVTDLVGASVAALPLNSAVGPAAAAAV
jgi:hypothetical protein